MRLHGDALERLGRALTITSSSQPGNQFDGVLDELAIYDRELAAEEITRHHAAGRRQP